MNIELTLETQADRSSRPFQFPVEGDLVFGRGPDSAVALDGTALSREHFALRNQDGSLQLQDLSSNGTWLNGQRLGKGVTAPVAEGAVIEIPGYRLHVRAIAAAALSSPTAVPARAEPAATDSVPSQPRSPLRMVFGPVIGFWNGFTGIEKLLLWVAASAGGLLLAYLNSN
ncbi:MAG: FHA domain-containing protein [Bryobacteraceae bacterium]